MQGVCDWSSMQHMSFVISEFPTFHSMKMQIYEKIKIA